MEDILEEPETILEKDMVFTILTKPTETFRYIFKYCPTKNVNGIINVYGVVNALAINLQFLLNQTRFSILLTIIIALFGWLFTWIWVYICSSLMSWTGKWIGGHADMDEFVTVSAWSYIPSIAAIFPLAVETIIFGNGDSMNGLENQNVVLIVLYYLMMGLKYGLNIWSLVILIKGTAVLQRFNYKKAILNVILVLLVIFVPAFIIGGLIYLF
jgi:hypothetical protein